MKKLALLTISPTHASVEDHRPASAYVPQYLAFWVMEGNVPSLSDILLELYIDLPGFKLQYIEVYSKP